MKQSHPLRDWRLRQQPRVTLSALAKEVSVSPSYLSEVENGNKGLSLDLAVRLSRITQIDVEKFSGEVPQ